MAVAPRTFSIMASTLYLLIQLTLVGRTESADLDCLACSYTYTGDTGGKSDIGCVNDVHNFSKKIPVKCRDGYCSITAAYSTGYTRLNSIARGCAPVEKNNCDAPTSIMPRCQFRCSTPNCNDINGNLWPRIGGHSGGDQVPGNTADRPLIRIVSLLASLSICLVWIV